MDNKNPNYVMAQCGNYGTLNLQLKLVNGLLSLLTTHTHTAMEQPSEQFWVQYLAQGHFDMQLQPGIEPTFS